MNPEPEPQALSIKAQELNLIKKALNQYRKQLRQVRQTKSKHLQAIDGLEVSVMKCWDEKAKGKLRCKMITALARLESTEAHETRLLKYINALKKEQLGKKIYQAEGSKEYIMNE